MNADSELFGKDLNCWRLTDVKSDNQLFEKELNGLLEWEADSETLRCVVCELEFFCHIQYTQHLLQHVAQPSVLLSPIKRKRLHKLLAGERNNLASMTPPGGGSDL